ncbi:MAG: preprotein translocase subunit YajC [Arcobacteraceae bacterium]|jgi:preprotein translocase subunit YajC|nr:preprotein translocase subunit YajC [Arcobacteraceae bacterium]MDY0326786.1 preprotein translocase subunit YajC [Arcobacteraceae bacterium]
MDGSLIGSLLPLIVLFAIFYFLIIRPQQQTAKKHKQMLENMKKGDKIVTSGGLIAEVAKVEDEFFRIKLADNTEVKIVKEYVARLVEESAK